MAEPTSGIDIKFLLSAVASALAFVFWVVKLFVQDYKSWVAKKRDQDNLVRALYAEIDFNTRDMEEFLRKSISAEGLRVHFLKNTELTPHITDARHTEVYRNRIGDIHSISDAILQQVINFYGLLEKIRVQIEGVNYPSYQTISLDGKVHAVEVIRSRALEAEESGRKLLGSFEAEYDRLSLRRFLRSETLDGNAIAKLTDKVEKLAKAHKSN